MHCMLLKSLRKSKKVCNCRTEEAAKYLEQTKLQTSNGFTEEFTVMEDLMGLAIGLDVAKNSLKPIRMWLL